MLLLLVANAVSGLPAHAPSDLRAITGACIFVVLAAPVLFGRGILVVGQHWQLCLREPLLACVLAVLLTALVERRISVEATLATLAAVPPALAEELVFRVALPSRISSIIDASRGQATPGALVGAVVGSQVVFALCHLLLNGPMAVSTQDLGRLAVAGLFFYLLVRWGGLWMATGVHAALNSDLLRISHSHSGIHPFEIALLAPAAFLLLWSVHRPASPVATLRSAC